MRALALVMVFWTGWALIVGWALGLAYAIDAGQGALVVPLIAVPVIALSAFLWFVFSVALDA